MSKSGNIMKRGENVDLNFQFISSTVKKKKSNNKRIQHVKQAAEMSFTLSRLSSLYANVSPWLIRMAKNRLSQGY